MDAVGSPIRNYVTQRGKYPKCAPAGVKCKYSRVYATFVGAHLPGAPREPAKTHLTGWQAQRSLARRAEHATQREWSRAQRVFFVVGREGFSCRALRNIFGDC